LRVGGRGQEGFEGRPVECSADQRRNPLDGVFKRHDRAVRDDMHRWRRPRLDPSIGGIEVEGSRLPGGLTDQFETFRRTTGEHIAAEPIPAHQPSARVAHRVEPLQPKLEPQGEFLRRGVDGRVLGQQQAAFEVRQPRRHYEIIGRDFQTQGPGTLDIGEILLDQRQDRDLVEVDLLLAGEVEEQVERTFPAVETEIQRLVFAHRRNE